MADERFKEATPRPWHLHTFHTSNGEREALHCVGKSMTGRDWTAYLKAPDGTSVLQTDGATEQEAIANAVITFEAVNSYDPLRTAALAALEFLDAINTDLHQEPAPRRDVLSISEPANDGSSFTHAFLRVEQLGHAVEQLRAALDPKPR